MIEAVEYVRTGLALIPLGPQSKKPRGAGWQQRGNAIVGEDEAKALRDGVGLAHAYCSPPTMALDIDNMPRATVWLKSRGVALPALLAADDAVQVSSGRPGSAKLIYRLPAGASPIESVAIKEKSAERRELTILEFRCATRGGLTVQDVLPPSIHPLTRQPYRWAGKGDWRNLPILPDALLAVWRDELAARHMDHRGNSRLSLFKGVDDTPRQRARVAEMLRYVPADCSYELYRDTVWAILSLGWADSEIIAEQWCRTAPHRFKEPSFQAVVASYDETRTPTIGTIHHYAKMGGWNG